MWSNWPGVQPRAAHPCSAQSTPASLSCYTLVLCRDGEYSEDSYYGTLYDWLFDDSRDVHVVLAQLSSSSANPGAPEYQAAPSLPVFAVFAGSSKASGVPVSVNATATSGRSQELELLVAPLSANARTPVPHTTANEGQPGLQFDPRCAGWPRNRLS